MWEINVTDQTLTLLNSMCLGGLLCAFYDLLRAIRKSGCNSYLAVFLSDMLFWIISAFVTFIFLISRTNGEIRGYVILSEAIGFLLFRISLSRLWFKIWAFCFREIFILNTKTMSFLNKFYINFEKMLFKIYYATLKFLKSMKKLLKNTAKLLYTNGNKN